MGMRWYWHKRSNAPSFRSQAVALVPLRHTGWCYGCRLNNKFGTRLLLHTSQDLTYLLPVHNVPYLSAVSWCESRKDKTAGWFFLVLSAFELPSILWHCWYLACKKLHNYPQFSHSTWSNAGKEAQYRACLRVSAWFWWFLQTAPGDFQKDRRQKTVARNPSLGWRMSGARPADQRELSEPQLGRECLAWSRHHVRQSCARGHRTDAERLRRPPSSSLAHQRLRSEVDGLRSSVARPAHDTIHRTNVHPKDDWGAGLI